MRMPSAIAAASIAIALFAAGFAVGHGVHHSSNSAAPKGGAEVLGQVFARTPRVGGPTTTTAAAANAPQAPPTSQAAAATTTTKAPTTAATATPPPPTTSPPATTTRQVSGACGNGTAQASLQSSTHPRSLSSNTDYETDVVATVDNNVNKAIQIDALAIRLVFADGSTQSYSFDQAIGSVVQAGQSAKYGVALRTATPPNEIQLTAFGFHTAGQPQCPARAA